MISNSLTIIFYRNVSQIAFIKLLTFLSSCVTQRNHECLQGKNNNIKAFSEALGLPGTINEYCNRYQVEQVRNKNRGNILIIVDLTNSYILSPVYFNLKPNDIEYVKPLKKRYWGVREFPFSILLSSIFDGLLICT